MGYFPLFPQKLSVKTTEKEIFMKLSIQKLISALLSCLFFGSGAAVPAASGWYCKREKDHKRPTLDASIAYIENKNAVYLGPDEKVIYLTFDAGYENGNVARILDTLKKHEVPGAFFILDNLILRETELVKRMKDEGHLVCNHTAKHPDITKLPPEGIETELQKLETLYEEKIGGKMAPFFRPPEGKFDEKSLSAVEALGYTTVFWSLAYADWDNNKQPNPEASKKLLRDNIHNGAVILLHPTSKTNADILDSLITEWKAEGYRFGTLEELSKK